MHAHTSAFRWKLVAVLLIALAWRVPSLIDPPWVNDEGTYFAVAQAMAHGYRLYADVWENKPPGIYLLYSAVYHLAGPSLIAVRLGAMVTALLLVILTLRLALRYAKPEAALVAAMLVGLLLGVPFLEGTTANAELFLAALTAFGVYLAPLTPDPSPSRGEGSGVRGRLAGLTLAGAILFKAVAGFDAAAIGLWLLLHRFRRELFAYLAALAAALLCVLVLAWLSGILGPMLRDALLYDFGYVGQKNGGGVPWVVGLKLGALAALSVLLRRAPFPYLWLVYAAAGSLISGRFFGHYALQVVVPAGICAAHALSGQTTVARRALVALPAGFLALAGLSAVCGWAMVVSGHDTILARRLGWYVNFVRVAVGAESRATYRGQIDDHVNRNLKVAAALSDMPSGPLLVWGNTPWVYVLSNRLPATAYTSSLRDPEVPGETRTLRRAVILGTAPVVVIIAPPAPPLGAAAQALQRQYRQAERIENATIYVSRACGARCQRAARTAARASSGTR